MRQGGTYVDAYIRYDPLERLKKSLLFEDAARRIDAGAPS